MYLILLQKSLALHLLTLCSVHLKKQRVRLPVSIEKLCVKISKFHFFSDFYTEFLINYHL